MASYLDELNDVQRAAVTTTEGPVLVIAGPGSGKTRVLTYRIAHLLESGVAPWEILTLTFTNKAAREMKERISRVVGDRAQHVWAGTFHSVFARILRVEASKLGFPSTFSIYDTDDTTSLLRAIIKEMQLDPQVYNAAAVRSRISLAKSNLRSPAAYREDAEMMNADRLAKRPYLVDIYEKYVARCQRAGAMDFDDLLFQLYRLFRDNPDQVVEKYRQKFRYLHVDEFQDTNYLQYAILRRLVKYPGSPENVFIVGDDAQSIYAFRGATIDNILDFEKDFPTLKTFKLEQNYRSTHHIVAAANEVISYNRRQLQKTIWTDRLERQKIKLLKCQTDDEEGRRVADLILEQKNRFHLPNAEIAILYRTNAQSRKFEEHLRRLNMPYRIFGGTSFYQRKEVKDFVAYLRLSVNPQDEEALRRVINFPTRGIGESTVEKISQLAAVTNRPMYEVLTEVEVSERTRRTLGNFKAMIAEFADRAPREPAYQLAVEILRRSELLDLLKSDTTPEGVGRLENVQAVLDAISEFVDSNTGGGGGAGAPVDDAAPPRGVPTLFDGPGLPIAEESVEPAPAPTIENSLAAYLQTITLLTDADEDRDERDFITLMSTHAAKGLEFRSVFVTGLEENLFPSFMALEDPNGLDEERRLFYVAITRAKEFLTITYAQNRYRHGQIRISEPSRFLDEISSQHFDLVGGFSALRQGSMDDGGNSRTSSGASLSGNFTMPVRRAASKTGPAVAPADFRPSPPDAILPGVTVLHLKFGLGKVTQVEGPKDNKVATIQFHDDEVKERKIVLKFAKLQVK
jgi:DNA helicase-2/ATP-dependent DNA helicase PcrA